MIQALDISVLGGPTGDESRAPRTQNHTGPQPSFNREGQAGPISLIRGSFNYGSKWSNRSPGLYSALEGGSVQAPDSQGLKRLKETWKGTLEQQDGHNNKPDT